jgi:hypothetical protein
MGVIEMKSKSIKVLAILGLLLIIVLGFAGCSSPCATPLCSNNAELFRDLCSRCRNIADGIQGIFGN